MSFEYNQSAIGCAQVTRTDTQVVTEQSRMAWLKELEMRASLVER